MAQAKRARSMATCAEVILVDEGDKQITALVDSGACLSAAPLAALHRSQHLVNKEQALARQLCTATGRPMAMAGEIQVRLRFKGSTRIFTISMQISSATRKCRSPLMIVACTGMRTSATGRSAWG